MTDKTYISNKEVEKHCTSIGREMALDKWQPDYIVGITRGGLMPANLLSQLLSVPMYALNVSMRDNAGNAESNSWMAEDALNEMKILIVDDINDTGETLQWIMEDWERSNRPQSAEWDATWGKNVRFATVINNESSAFTEIAYSGTTINKAEHDTWVVFPWEDWWTAKP